MSTKETNFQSAFKAFWLIHWNPIIFLGYAALVSHNPHHKEPRFCVTKLLFFVSPMSSSKFFYCKRPKIGPPSGIFCSFLPVRKLLTGCHPRSQLFLRLYEIAFCISQFNFKHFQFFKSV